MSESLFREAFAEQKAIAVPMNKWGVVKFINSPMRAIGTDGLGSCSVILIVSPYAAILGHVAPLSSRDAPDVNGDTAGEHYVRQFMDGFTAYYQKRKEYFPQTQDSWVICAIYEGATEVVLPHIQTIMVQKLQAVGLNPNTDHNYEVPFTPDHPNRGTIFVDGRDSDIVVYVENKEVKRIQKPKSIPPSQAGSSTTMVSQQYQTRNPQNYHQSSYPAQYPQNPSQTQYLQSYNQPSHQNRNPQSYHQSSYPAQYSQNPSQTQHLQSYNQPSHQNRNPQSYHQSSYPTQYPSQTQHLQSYHQPSHQTQNPRNYHQSSYPAQYPQYPAQTQQGLNPSQQTSSGRPSGSSTNTGQGYAVNQTQNGEWLWDPNVGRYYRNVNGRTEWRAP